MWLRTAGVHARTHALHANERLCTPLQCTRAEPAHFFAACSHSRSVGSVIIVPSWSLEERRQHQSTIFSAEYFQHLSKPTHANNWGRGGERGERTIERAARARPIERGRERDRERRACAARHAPPEEKCTLAKKKREPKINLSSVITRRLQTDVDK